MRWFRFVNPRIEELEAKCHLLSVMMDKYAGENTVLKEQLAQVQYEKSQLLEKIFDLTGVNRHSTTSVTSAIMKTPISDGRSQPWPKRKEELEVKARREYWEKKRRDEETKGRVENLEKEVGIGGEENAS